MAHLLAVTDADFEETVRQAELPVLVDFWAEWCSPCKMMRPLLATLAEEEAAKLQIVELDVQANGDTAMRLGVLNLPTLILFVDGEEKERLAGYVPIQKIKEVLQSYI
ncbi:MAG: thioredoxin [Anaerolineae bacterium]|nr:thioredoxin [Anaerolineae bacterium]